MLADLTQRNNTPADFSVAASAALVSATLPVRSARKQLLALSYPDARLVAGVSDGLVTAVPTSDSTEIAGVSGNRGELR
jgi:hypothetical protein